MLVHHARNAKWVNMDNMQVVRDQDGLPTLVNVHSEGRTYKITFDRDKFLFNKTPTPKVLELLKLVYPHQKQAELFIPEPLTTVAVQGGETVFFDDSEGLLKWNADAGAVAADNANAFHGSQSIRVTAAGGVPAISSRYFPMPPSKKIEFSCIWGCTDFTVLDNLRFIIDVYDGNHLARASVNYDPQTITWQYLTAGNAYAAVPGSQNSSQYESLNVVAGVYHKIRFSADFANFRYLGFEADDFKTELTNGFYNIIAVNERYAAIYLYVDPTAANASVANFDDILIKEVK